MQEATSINLLSLQAVNNATSLLQLGCVLLIAGRTGQCFNLVNILCAVQRCSTALQQCSSKVYDNSLL